MQFPDPLDPFSVHSPAGLSKEGRDSSITVASISASKLNDISGEPVFLG